MKEYRGNYLGNPTMTNSDFKPLEILRGKTIRNLETEISMLASLGHGVQETHFEIPLKLTFDQHELFIYNKWRIENVSPTGIESLIQRVVEQVVFANNILSFVLDNVIKISVNFTDEGYSGPEAMVLYGPGNSVIVWD